MLSTKAATSAHHFPGVDLLRASMMLLGVVLHAALSYVEVPLDAWPFKDAHHHVGFDCLVAFIHAFRMPVFFALSGFFAAMLDAKLGPEDFVRNRARRVLKPLLIGWPILFPATVLAFVFAGLPLSAVRPGLGHLWFLSYLCCYYALALWPFWSRLAPAARVVTRGRFAPLALGTGVLYLQAPNVSVPVTPMGFLPETQSFTAYGLFFMLGWILWHQEEERGALTRRSALHMTIGVGAFAIAIALLARDHEGSRAIELVQLALAGVSWFMTLGLLGWALGRSKPPSRWIRALSRASFSIYLLHLPIAVWVAVLLRDLSLPAFAKLPIVFGFALALPWAIHASRASVRS